MNQNIRALFVLAAGLFTLTAATLSFKSEQKKYPRVKSAYEEKESYIKRRLAAKGIKLGEPLQIYLRAFKEEN